MMIIRIRPTYFTPFFITLQILLIQMARLDYGVGEYVMTCNGEYQMANTANT